MRKKNLSKYLSKNFNIIVHVRVHVHVRYITSFCFNHTPQILRAQHTEYIYLGVLTSFWPASEYTSILGSEFSSWNIWAADILALPASGAKALACPRAIAPNTMAPNTLKITSKGQRHILSINFLTTCIAVFHCPCTIK